MHNKANRLLLAAILMLGYLPAFGQSVQEVARLGLSSTVTLVAYDASGRAFSSGSGFVVAPGLVLTNYHVIEGAHDVEARALGTSGSVWLDAVVLHDPRLDLALLAFSRVEGPPLELRTGERPEIGETVFAVGSPLGLEGTFTQGIVSSYREGAGVQLMQITAPISPGSSGGAVMDASGKVVGVVVATMLDGQNLNFAIPATQVQRFLARLDATPPSASSSATASEPLAVGAPAPSFDCALASTWSELAICASHRLSKLDVLLSEAYARAREGLSEAAFEAVRHDQRAWLTQRETCEAQPHDKREACLAELIRERTVALARYQ